VVEFVASEAGRDAGSEDVVARLNERDATALYNGVIVDINPSLVPKPPPLLRYLISTPGL